jgi:hypothetical protein
VVIDFVARYQRVPPDKPANTIQSLDLSNVTEISALSCLYYNNNNNNNNNTIGGHVARQRRAIRSPACAATARQCADNTSRPRPLDATPLESARSASESTRAAVGSGEVDRSARQSGDVGHRWQSVAVEGQEGFSSRVGALLCVCFTCCSCSMKTLFVVVFVGLARDVAAIA